MSAIAALCALLGVACAGPDQPGAGASDGGRLQAASASSQPEPPVATVLGAASSRAPGPQDNPGLCTAICARSEGLHCREASTCVRRCEAMRAMPVCQAVVRSALDCFAATPSDAWTCNDHGLPSVRVGRCDAEQSQVAQCFVAHPPPAVR